MLGIKLHRNVCGCKSVYLYIGTVCVHREFLDQVMWVCVCVYGVQVCKLCVV